jgi:asparagine synthase (glutamine-hydrolysing)
MCGITGFWQRRPGADPVETLQRMTHRLRHRGPDDSGTFFDAAAGVGLGFRRLAIIDLSPRGHQPMESASGRYIIVFNGEVYNFEEIRCELEPLAWRGRSDTEVMLEAFERWGVEAALQRFVGMFAIALWDSQERRLYLARDRLGIKPLYYGWIGGDFVFGSELKALQEYPGFQGTIDRDQLADFLRFSYVPSPHSIYENIHKLEPGHILTLRSAEERPEDTAFWSATEVARRGMESPFAGSDEEILAELEKKIRESVRLRMIADVPLGAFLSGGIDSSIVVALMQAQSSRPVKTFSIGFHEEGYNEAQHAARVAAHLGTAHTELYVTPREAQEVIPLLSSIYDEPFGDPSQIPTYLVSRLARRSVTVSLSGDGGDELFCGYTRFASFQKVWSGIGRTPAWMRKGVAGSLQAFSPRSLERLAGLVPSVRRSLLPNPGRKLHKLAQALREGSRARVYLHHLAQLQGAAGLVMGAQESDLLLRRIARLDWVRDPRDAAMLVDSTNYLPDDVLTKLDRASMAVGLEGRVPLLDHRLVEFVWKLPLDCKVRNGQAKWALRRVAYRYIPASMLERPKMGFGVPVGKWLRGDLRSWGEELLSSERLRSDGLLNPAAVRHLWQEHLSGSHNWESGLWNLLIFQEWLASARAQKAALCEPATVANN